MLLTTIKILIYSLEEFLGAYKWLLSYYFFHALGMKFEIIIGKILVGSTLLKP